MYCANAHKYINQWLMYLYIRVPEVIRCVLNYDVALQNGKKAEVCATKMHILILHMTGWIK